MLSPPLLGAFLTLDSHLSKEASEKLDNIVEALEVTRTQRSKIIGSMRISEFEVRKESRGPTTHSPKLTLSRSLGNQP